MIQTLPEIARRTTELGFNMGSEPLTGALLRTLAASKPGGRILEIGTGTGLGSAWLLNGMDAQSKLTTIDVDAAAQQIARDVLGSDPRIEFVLGDALAYLQSSTEMFDLVFADAMPGKYEGLADALAVVKPGGFYIIDDLLPQPNWPEGHAAKVQPLIDSLAANSELHIAQLDWASGIVIAVKGTS